MTDLPNDQAWAALAAQDTPEAREADRTHPPDVVAFQPPPGQVMYRVVSDAGGPVGVFYCSTGYGPSRAGLRLNPDRDPSVTFQRQLGPVARNAPATIDAAQLLDDLWVEDGLTLGPIGQVASLDDVPATG